ncbi:MAG: nodulation protein NfeD, partial [Thermodesulfobacteriota bacterium]
MKRILTLVLFVFFTVLAPRVDAAIVHHLKVEGIINPVISEFIIKGIEEAENEDAEAVIIQIDTPGGLDLSMRDIVKVMLASEIPIVVYVAPPGSRAASAG